MSNDNCCSESCNSPSLGNSCDVPITSASALCSSGVSCEDTPCSPTSSQGSNTLHDNCHEPVGEHMSCQSTSVESGACRPADCSLIASNVSGSHQGPSCLPITPRRSSFCHLASYRQPLCCHLPSYQSYGYQPLDHLTYGGQPLSYLSCGHQPLPYLSSRPHPLSCMSDYYRRMNCTYSNFQPFSSSLSDWKFPY